MRGPDRGQRNRLLQENYRFDTNNIISFYLIQTGVTSHEDHIE